MRRALDEYRIIGIKSTIPFHQELMNNTQFIAGQFDTTFVEQGFTLVERKLEEHLRAVAIAATLLAHRRTGQTRATVRPTRRPRQSGWKASGQWRI
jgi:acetyl/propionyl-CoA carboxylase alpha subunit